MERPFPGLPVCDRYLPVGPIDEAFRRLKRMLDRGETLGVVIGPPGTGKTLLCLKLASSFRNSHAVVHLGDLRLSSRQGLVQQVLYHLKQPHQGDEQTLHLALVQTLTGHGSNHRPLLLIVDESQALSAELLDEVRMMSNLIRDGRPLVQTILVGGPKLEDSLADPQLESLSQRIAARCYLHPLNQAETDRYIRESLERSGRSVDDRAVQSVFHATAGIPRLINQLMDRAIDAADDRDKQTIDGDCVQIAWADLQQLPSPIVEAELRSCGSPVEFGELDGDGFDFDNEATPIQPAAVSGDGGARGSSYTDVESVLDSLSIDCLSEASSPSEYCENAAPRSETGRAAGAGAAPDDEAQPPRVELKTTHTTIPTPAEAMPTPEGDDLFGGDFDQEVPLALQWSGVAGGDSTEAMLSLHAEIRDLTDEAASAFGGFHSKDSSREPAAVSPRPLPPPQPRAVNLADSDFGCESAIFPLDDAPEGPESCDIPHELTRPMSVVWSDEPPAEIDDRDLLVIEDDVTMVVDSAFDSPANMGGRSTTRKPCRQVDQNYQNLFSRLRGGQ